VGKASYSEYLGIGKEDNIKTHLKGIGWGLYSFDVTPAGGSGEINFRSPKMQNSLRMKQQPQWSYRHTARKSILSETKVHEKIKMIFLNGHCVNLY
jgi:hypothetical protein